MAYDATYEFTKALNAQRAAHMGTRLFDATTAFVQAPQASVAGMVAAAAGLPVAAHQVAAAVTVTAQQGHQGQNPKEKGK